MTTTTTTTDNGTTNTNSKWMQAGKPMAIPWKQIIVPTDQNIRSDDPDTMALAESMKRRGQLTPVVVEPSANPVRPYTLVCGFGRMTAFELNGWTDRDVLAVVRPARGPIQRIADNWAENQDREDVSTFDLAERLHQLVTGTYPVTEGEEAEPLEKDAICELLGLAKNYVNKLLRIHANVDPDVAKKARKTKAPLRLLIALSHISGEGEEKGDQEEDRQLKQEKVLSGWIEHQEALAEMGRQRSERNDSGGGGKKGKKGEEKSAIVPLRPTRKLDTKKRTAVDYLKVLARKRDELAAEKKPTVEMREQTAKLQGAIEMLEYVTGQRTKFQSLGITEADFKMLAAEEAEVEEETEEEEAAEG